MCIGNRENSVNQFLGLSYQNKYFLILSCIYWKKLKEISFLASENLVSFFYFLIFSIKRSRFRNLMQYGFLGGQEFVRQKYRNLEQKVLLECDGTKIPLKNVQGIVVLNIPSYTGGVNFWGHNSKDEHVHKIISLVFITDLFQTHWSRMLIHILSIKTPGFHFTFVWRQNAWSRGDQWYNAHGLVKSSEHKEQSYRSVSQREDPNRGLRGRTSPGGWRGVDSATRLHSPHSQK